MPANHPSSGERGNEQQPYVIIEHEWYSELTGNLRHEVANFARNAARYDAEAGFTQIGDLERVPQLTGGPARRLVVRLVEVGSETHTGGHLAAYLSVGDVDAAGIGRVEFVVAPEHRSKGIATLLLERLFQEPAARDWHGTGLTGLRFLADGAHPAAARISARFGFELESETWLLLRMLREYSAQARDPEEDGIVHIHQELHGSVLRAGIPVPSSAVDPASGRSLEERTYRRSGASEGAVLISRHGSDITGARDRTAWMGFGPAIGELTEEQIGDLIERAARDLASRGAVSVLAQVDPSVDALVRATRRHFFQHDQSNLVYLALLPAGAAS